MLPRLFLAWWYWTSLTKITMRMEYVRTMIHVAAGLNVAELTSLLVLSFIDSDNRLQSHVHKLAFGGFLLFSIGFFSLQLYLFSHCCLKEYGKKLSKILVLKRVLLILYLVTILACMFSYWRHVTYCETGVYSAFAILEYIVVILNIGLHATAALDFREDVLSFQFFKLSRNEK